MNAAIETGIQQIKGEAKVEGYKLAIKDVRAEIHGMMNEDEKTLWGVLGILSRLEALASRRASEGRNLAPTYNKEKP